MLVNPSQVSAANLGDAGDKTISDLRDQRGIRRREAPGSGLVHACTIQIANLRHGGIVVVLVLYQAGLIAVAVLENDRS